MIKRTEMEYKKSLIKNLGYLIKKSGMKKKDIEEELQLGTGYLSKIFNENDMRMPSFITIVKIADMLETTIDTLLNGNVELEEGKSESTRINDKLVSAFSHVLKDTEEGILEWTKLLMVSYERKALYGNLFEQDVHPPFQTKFVSQLKREIGSASQGYECWVKPWIKMVIVKLSGDSLNDEVIYEAYFIKENKAYLIGNSHDGEIKNNEEYDKLDMLWNEIEDYVSFGKAKKELNIILDEVLQDMPF